MFKNIKSYSEIFHFIWGERVVDAQFVYREENLGDERRKQPRNLGNIFCSEISSSVGKLSK